ncbi:MAG: GWxTD domain-containing protein [Acidobacteriota bacterium]|nr:GWxTD domain-containing protein [Acidobacteriota bacterium]
MKFSPAFRVLVGITAAALAGASLSFAQTKQAGSSSSGSETIAKPLTQKQIKRKQKELQKELEGPWKKWMNEDVVYIITDEEKQAFKRLRTDEERQQFVEQFWQRRDPTPDTEENEFKEEHYRRIAYANDHYASGIQGWRTDRGMIYIKYGPADEIDSHPSGGSYERPQEEGGGETSTYPFEDWRYRYLENIGTNIIIEFVDKSMSGEYKISTDPEEKDALLYVPGAGLTQMEQMGMANKTQRFQRTDGTHLGTGNQPLPESMNEFTRIEQYAKLQAPPAIKFKDLEAAVDSKIRYNTLPMMVKADYIRVTDSTVLTSISIKFKNSDLQYKTKDNASQATVNIYGRVTSLTRRPVNWFEDTVLAGPFPAEMLQKSMNGSQLYSKTIPLAPGTYRLNIVAKDTVGNTMNNYEVALNVPHYDEDQLGASSVILADQIERVPTRSIGAGPFVIRSSKVRPRVDDTFKQSETMGIYAELYNFGMDEKTKKPEGSVEYDVVNTANQTVLTQTEQLSAIPNSSSFLVTVEKKLPLNSLAPGKYTLKLKVIDKLKNKTIIPSAGFTVTS